MLAAARLPVIYIRSSSLRIKDMETEKLASKRKDLLKTLLKEELGYLREYRAFWLTRIWNLAKERGYITVDEIYENLPKPLFEMEEFRQITHGLIGLDIVVCEKVPSIKELRRHKESSRGRLPGLLAAPRVERDFVRRFTESTFSKRLSRLAEALDSRHIGQTPYWEILKATATIIGNDGNNASLRADAYKAHLESIRKGILDIKKVEDWLDRGGESLPDSINSKIESLFSMRIDRAKLIGLWELASKHGFVTHEVIKELAPEHIIKANQTDQIASFFTELGIYVCDEAPSDEKLSQLPEPHIVNATIHIGEEDAFQGIYEFDEWRFLNTFTSDEAKEKYCSSLALDSFSFDLLLERLKKTGQLDE